MKSMFIENVTMAIMLLVSEGKITPREGTLSIMVLKESPEYFVKLISKSQEKDMDSLKDATLKVIQVASNHSSEYLLSF